MTASITNLTRVIRAQISTQSVLYKAKSWQRLKMKTEVDASTKTKSLDLKASKNREIWQKEAEAVLSMAGRVCKDDVFFMRDYEPLKLSIEEAIGYHKEHCCDAAMLDAPYAILRADFVLNMRTKKATKFVQKVTGVIVPPHELTFLPKKKIIAFCKSPEETAAALSSGASHAGGDSLIAQLEQGLVHYEEYDQAVCQRDFLPSLTRLRSLLRDKLPLRQGPRVGDDIGLLVTSFVRGIEFESRTLEGVPEEARLSLPIGEACWPLEHLRANLLAVVAAVEGGASSQLSGGLITKAILSCPPSDEILLLRLGPSAEVGQ